MIFNKKKIIKNKSKDKSKDKEKISLNSIPKKKNSKNNNLSIAYKFIKYKLIPLWQKKTEALNSLIIREEGSEVWSAISPSQKWSSRIVWTLVSVTAFGIVYSSFAVIDETVQTTGKIEPKGKTIDVKVPLGGVIKEILVNEGQLVDLNQVLLKLDTTAVNANLKALERVKSQIKADILLSKIQLGEEENIEQLTSNQKLKLISLRDEYNSRINASVSSVNQIKFQKESMIENIKSQEEVLEIRKNILIKLKSLSEIGGLSRIKFLKEQQEVIQLQGRLASARADLNKISSSLNEAENRLQNTIASTKIDFTTKIEENVKQVAQLENQISESKLTLSYQNIKSPVDGLVFDLQAEAPGYVVNSNLPILKIVPVDGIVGRVFLSNKDIAFIKLGQNVKVRVDAYPYNEFGELEGEIESIGSDVLEPDEAYPFYRFPVTVKLNKPFIEHKGKKLPLMTGMSLSANVVLRGRPLISIFTERILPFWDSLEQI